MSFVFTDVEQSKDPGSSIKNVEDDRRGNDGINIGRATLQIIHAMEILQGKHLVDNDPSSAELLSFLSSRCTIGFGVLTFATFLKT